jgi:hemoglobin
MSHALLARAGGFASVRHVVSAFYDKAIDNALLQRHFVDLDLPRLIDHQTKLIAGLMDGNHAIDDEMLRRVHARLGITGPEFDEMTTILRQTLEEHGYSAADTDRVCLAFRQRRHLVVARMGGES